MRSARPLTPGTTGWSAVLPLRIGLRTFGLVALERSDAAFDPAQVTAAETILEELGLRLETALLFSEVRSLATAEERRRLAREIHDGIAQELASLGYVVDDLAARARYIPDLETDLHGAAQRADPGHQRAAAVDLRPAQRGADAPSGSAPRCPTTSARSARARTSPCTSCWTSPRPGCPSTPRPSCCASRRRRSPTRASTPTRRTCGSPAGSSRRRAYLAVEDDGGGLGRPRADSFGLEIMRERAQRIGAAPGRGEPATKAARRSR